MADVRPGSGPRNRCAEITYRGERCVAKRYGDPARFACECRELPRFARHGFRVPAIRRVDPVRLLVVLEKLPGFTPPMFTPEQIGTVIDELARVARTLGLRHDPSTVDQYLGQLERCLEMDGSGMRLNQGRLGVLSASARRIAYVSTFKDSKPENWIFNGDRVALVDFDYVKPSFFLADLAQFLTSLALRQWVDASLWLDHYLAALPIPREEPNALRVAFALARLQSNLASVRHNPNIGDDARRGFICQNKTILVELGLRQPGEGGL